MIHLKRPKQQGIRKWHLGVVMLLTMSLGGIAACSPTAQETSSQSSPVSDASPSGDDVSENAPAPEGDVNKIVALTSLTADLVHTMDDDKLVAIPGSSILRDDNRFSDLEVVSEGRSEPNLEKIVALKPDLVIGAKGFHSKTLTKLNELGIKTVETHVDDWDSLKALTENLAQQIGADPEPLLNRYDACLAEASDSKGSALILVGRQPLLSPNKDSWAGNFLDEFNVQNLTADLQGQSPFEGYVTLSEETVLTSNPDVLIVVDTQENSIEQFKEESFWGKLKATQTDSVHSFNYFGLVNPGTIGSVEETCQKLGNL